MDAALAALIGAGIGLTGTVVAPLVTHRWAHKARRRDVMREAYAEGMRAFGDIGRCESVEDLRNVMRRLIASQIQIQLVGSRRASRQFDELVSATGAWVESIKKEASIEGWDSDSPLPVGEVPKSMHCYHTFVSLVRRDIGMEDPVASRLRRYLRIKRKQS